MNKFIKHIVVIAILCGSTLTALSYAQAEDPQQVVRKTTEQVLTIIKNAKNHPGEQPKDFNAEVTAVMDRVIDFDDFARSVMGTYASGQRYKALTSESEKIAFRERIQRFSLTFKQGLIDTYATSLLNFNGEKIETLPLQKGIDLSTGSATVMQTIFSSSGKSYIVQYSMHRNREGEWKVKNLIIEGINLGLTYRNQFAEAANKYHGDIDKVIANWNVEPEIDVTKSGVSKKEVKK
jgi:phospholipid transport system substrate-binding protein